MHLGDHNALELYMGAAWVKGKVQELSLDMTNGEFRGKMSFYLRTAVHTGIGWKPGNGGFEAMCVFR